MHESSSEASPVDESFSILDAVREEDKRNAVLESRQELITTSIEIKVDGFVFKLTRHEPKKKRTYKDVNGKDVHYPEMLMVHGFASDESYFGGVKDGRLTEQMCRLGLTINTITLPNGMGHLSAKQILEVQARGVQAAYNLLSVDYAKGSEVILVAHSRGAIVATHAAELLYKEHAEYDNLSPEEQAKSAKPLKGLALLAPAGVNPIGSDKARRRLRRLGHSLSVIGSAALTLPGLAKESINDMKYHPKSTISHIGMAAISIASDPKMRLKEAEIAASSDIKPILKKLSYRTSIIIIGTKNDAFIKSEDLSKFCVETVLGIPKPPQKPNIEDMFRANISLINLEEGQTHMLLGRRYKSYADPREVPGILLNFQQSIMPDPVEGSENGYLPNAYNKGVMTEVDEDGNEVYENGKGHLGIPKPSRL